MRNSCTESLYVKLVYHSPIPPTEDPPLTSCRRITPGPMSNGRYCCISRAERPLSSLLAAGAAPLVCPTINDCLEPNVKRLRVLITATAIEAARLTFCVSRGTIGILNFTRTVRKGKKISGGRWPHGLMRIFAVGRENLDRFDNTNSRKSVNQWLLEGAFNEFIETNRRGCNPSRLDDKG